MNAPQEVSLGAGPDAPAWPIVDGHALRFIGQLALGNDELEQGVVYVFQSTSDSFTLVTQHS